MKRISVTIIIVFATMISSIQAQLSEHLSFKGVPIDGTLNEYISKMKQKGLMHISTEDDVALLKGEFASYKDCIVGVSTLKQKDLVSKITVIFPARDSWSLLSSNYFTLKEMLTEKYGSPSEIVEKFDSYSDPTDDGTKMSLVKLDRFKFYSIYETEKGNIELMIHGDMSNSFVRLSYFDKINGEIVKAKVMDDL